MGNKRRVAAQTRKADSQPQFYVVATINIRRGDEDNIARHLNSAMRCGALRLHHYRKDNEAGIITARGVPGYNLQGPLDKLMSAHIDCSVSYETINS